MSAGTGGVRDAPAVVRGDGRVLVVARDDALLDLPAHDSRLAGYDVEQ